MTFLLDVNVLIALVDPTHINHDAVHDWFEALDRRLSTAALHGGRTGLLLV